MIYQYARRYLKNNLKNPKYEDSWTSLNNLQFLSYIKKRYTNEEVTTEISEVREAFKDFFEPIGSIVFRYKEGVGVKLKVFPYRIEPKDSKHLTNIENIIHKNKSSIKYPYQNQNDQIAILGKIRRKINAEIIETDESINKKELVKYAIRIALKLADKDIVVQLKRKFIVKIFEQNTVLESEKDVKVPLKKEGIQNRYNGYTIEQIEETYKEIFDNSSTDIKYFLKSVMKVVLTKELDFGVISNIYYEDNALRLIHAQIARELNKYVSLEQDYILGITGFLMREHFHKVHELMVLDILEKIFKQSVNAHKFILYYNGNTVLINNKKFQVPSLETEDGRRWNNTSLIGVCNVWMNNKTKLEKFKHRLMDSDGKIDDLNEALSHIEPEKKVQEDLINEAEKELLELNKHHLQLETKFTYLENTSLNSDEYFEVKEEIAKSFLAIDEVNASIAEGRKSIFTIKNSNLAAYNDLHRLKALKKQLAIDIKSQESNMHTKNTQMVPIMKSLIQALMARQKIVK